MEKQQELERDKVPVMGTRDDGWIDIGSDGPITVTGLNAVLRFLHAQAAAAGATFSFASADAAPSAKDRFVTQRIALECPPFKYNVILPIAIAQGEAKVTNDMMSFTGGDEGVATMVIGSQQPMLPSHASSVWVQLCRWTAPPAVYRVSSIGNAPSAAAHQLPHAHLGAHPHLGVELTEAKGAAAAAAPSYRVFLPILTLTNEALADEPLIVRASISPLHDQLRQQIHQQLFGHAAQFAAACGAQDPLMPGSPPRSPSALTKTILNPDT